MTSSGNLLLAAACVAAAAPAAAQDSPLDPILSGAAGSVVAIVGGGEAVESDAAGHLESLWAVRSADRGGDQVHVRNFAREGDTVLEQRRDVGFPSVAEQLEEAGAAAVVFRFGRAEALDGVDPAVFRDRLAALLDEWATARGRRAVLVTPARFPDAPEERAPLPPDVAARRDARLAEIAAAIRQTAADSGAALVDVFAAMETTPKPGAAVVTHDGFQRTAAGHAEVALAFARAAGWDGIARAAQNFDPATGAWRDEELENLRRAVIAKNDLWFRYSRPQNWAFLGGDRTAQPSSRDHRDQNTRWFPAEMKEYLPLIATAEAGIRALAAAAADSSTRP